MLTTCGNAENTIEIIENEKSICKSGRNTIEHIQYTDLSMLINTNGFAHYKPESLLYFSILYKVDGWDNLYEKTIQLLKRDYPVQMNGIKEKLLFTFSDEDAIQLEYYLKRCWVSDENYKIECVLIEGSSNSSIEKDLSQEKEVAKSIKIEKPIFDDGINNDVQRKDDFGEDNDKVASPDEKHINSYDQDRTSLLREEQKTFEEIFGVSKENFNNDSIENVNLSPRINNVLRRYKVINVIDLLELTPKELFESKTIGPKIFNEIVNGFAKYCNEHKIVKQYVPQPMQETKDKLSDCAQDVISYRWKVLETSFNKDAKVIETIDNLKLIDISLLEACKNQPNHVEYLRKALSSFYEHYLPDDAQLCVIISLAKLIPQERFVTSIKGYIFAYTDDPQIECFLYDQIKTKSMTVHDYVVGIKKRRYSEKDFRLISKFLQWMSFDLNKDLSAIVENMHLDDREMTVVSLRGNGKTLEQIGQQIGVTRERVRQIESKVRRRFVKQLRITNFIKKLYAVRNEEVVLPFSGFREFFVRDTDLIIDLLHITKYEDYIYDSKNDALVMRQVHQDALSQGYNIWMKTECAFNIKQS